MIIHDRPAQTAIAIQLTSPDNSLSGSALGTAGRRIKKPGPFHPTARRRDAICLAVYVRPLLATAQQCMRAPEMWAVEGLVMRLLALWERNSRRAVARGA